MKVEIMDYCIRCGLCVEFYPALFALNFVEDRIDVLPAAMQAEESVLRQVALDCAVGAISVRKGEAE